MLRSMSMFIVDEASMIPVHALDAIDKLLKGLTGENIPFGGKIFVLGGDFRQVLPVMPHGSRTTTVENCLKRSPIWQHFKIIKLTENMRAMQDQKEFAEWVLQVGNGKLKCKTDTNADLIEIPPKTVVADNIIDSVFDDPNVNMTKRVILTPKNDASLLLNKQVLDRLPGAQRLYLSVDRVMCDDNEEQQNYPLEFINSLTPSGMPEHRLFLKVGAIIMLLRNLNIQSGLCNGSRLIVKELHENIIVAETITIDKHSVLIPRIKLAPSDINLPFILEHRQFPVRLAYSMTVNKAQGQTFDKVGIYLPAPVFSHGQLYVALSRAKSFKDIYIQICETATQGRRNKKYITQNIVYHEVL